MAKRIFSSIVGIAVLLGVYLLKNDIVFNIALVIVSIMGINEFYHAVKQKGFKPVETVGYVVCILLGFVRIC